MQIPIRSSYFPLSITDRFNARSQLLVKIGEPHLHIYNFNQLQTAIN